MGALKLHPKHAPESITDLDVCHDEARPNLERLARALEEMEATLRLPDPAERVDVAIDERLLAATQNLTLATEFGALDLLARPAGTAGYVDLSRTALEMKLEGGVSVPVASIDDLIRMKRASGRPKDLIEVEVLSALQDEMEGGRK